MSVDLSTYGSFVHDEGLQGQIVDAQYSSTISLVNTGAAAVDFSFAVAGDGAGGGKLSSAVTDIIKGLAIRQAIRPADVDGVVNYAQNDMMGVLDNGNMFVLAGESVTENDLACVLVATGKIGTAASAASHTTSAAGTNTGNGTLGTVTLGADVEAGVYKLKCTSTTSPDKLNVASAGTSSAIQHGGTGSSSNVTITASPATGSGCKVGVYKALFVEPASDLGNFAVFDPDGILIGTGKVGVAFTTHITFTITDGSADAVSGDYFTVTVLAANGGTFSLENPVGEIIASNIQVGSAYSTISDIMSFTVSDGSADFAVNDSFAITVTVSYNRIILDGNAGRPLARWLTTTSSGSVGKLKFAA